MTKKLVACAAAVTGFKEMGGANDRTGPGANLLDRFTVGPVLGPKADIATRNTS